MKNFYAFLLFLSVISYGQNGDNIPIKVSGADFNLKPGNNASTTEDKNITSFSVNYALKKDYKLKITGPNQKEITYKGPAEQIIDFKEEILEKSITIELLDIADKSEKKWLLIISGNTEVVKDAENKGSNDVKLTFEDKIKGMLPKNDFKIDGLTQTPFGYVDQDQYIHIFLDYRGNNLVTTIPQGIANAQYIVHVFSKESKNPDAPTYTISQTAGSFNDMLSLRNDNAKIELQSNDWTGKINHDQFQLSTSTSNITFELVAVTKENNTFKRTTIETYTIKMTPTHHVSFDVGFLKSELGSPSYTLVNTPDGAAQTVKVTDNGKSQGVTTLMATFYYSPIIILKDLLGYKVPFYKKNGRNFLDDHEIYERIYPTVGVGLKDKVFENLYFGFNWEIVRGLGLFYGWNYRKVNTFSMPGFEEGITTVTQDQFDYYTNTDWKIKPAYGIKLDLLVVLGLLGSK